MFGLQPLHVLIIVIAAVVIFMPSRLPEITRSLGKTVREFRSGLREPARPAVPPPPAAVSETRAPKQD